MSEAMPLADLPANLDALRAEIDRLDDDLHDVLMRRAEVVERVGALGVKGRVALRPGREAAMLRRLLARHAGGLPRRAVVRIWRELLAATTSMQGDYSVAVCETGADGEFSACAREHFGALTPLRVYHSPAQAIGQLFTGAATLAVLPIPQDGEAQPAAWWTALLHRDEPRIHVVALLPFWAARGEGTPRAQAYVVAPAAPDPSGQDRSLIGLELPPEMSRARLSTALSAAGLAPGAVLLRRDPAGSTLALVDVEGFVTEADPRLAALADVLRPPVVLGAYAVPLNGDPA
jgi:chorismate mutase / prephenate dehydratase